MTACSKKIRSECRGFDKESTPERPTASVDPVWRLADATSVSGTGDLRRFHRPALERAGTSACKMLILTPEWCTLRSRPIRPPVDARCRRSRTRRGQADRRTVRTPPGPQRWPRTRGSGVSPVLPLRIRQQVGTQLATVVSSEPADRGHPAVDLAAECLSHTSMSRSPIDLAQPLNLRSQPRRPTSIVDPASAGTRRRASEGLALDVLSRDTGWRVPLLTREGST
jgi:hypothetical protein